MDDVLERILDCIGPKHGSIKELADYLEVTPNVITNWKNGNSHSYRKYLKEIAAYFNVSVDYLLGKEEKPAANSDELSEDKIKFALFGGPATDEQYEEVKRFARYLKEQQKDEANK